ncbi:MAG: 50S ribosomal protein L35, partial [Candidatus Pacebacteria bacterium]|nr:50S ribosomal protein L35 [Candidatus Paceibacterota bacterium]
IFTRIEQPNPMPSKSFTKRIRITKNGKVVRRPMAIDHSRTRKSTKTNRNARKTLSLGVPMKKMLNY